jgi:hypothetical protein
MKEEEEEECPVCLSGLSGSITTVGCCKKKFHAECIIKCTKQKNMCPLCRTKDCIAIAIEEEQPQTVMVTESDHRVSAYASVIALVTVLTFIMILKFSTL